MPAQLSHALLVFLGGGLGCVLRFTVNELTRRPHEAFPWHTFAINVVGSFVLGLLWGTIRDREAWFFFLGTGLCGGFTTYSTFSLEAVALIDAGRWNAAAGYALGTVLAAIAGAFAGVRMAG